MESLPTTREEYRAWYNANIPVGVKWGECWCGCLHQPPFSTRDRPKALWFADEARMFAHKHRKRLDERYTVEDRGYTTPCWIWTGYCNPVGYGMLSQRRDGETYAHRWMYERTFGPLPSFPAHQLHHECEIKPCVNPEHLTLLSNLEHRRTYNLKLTCEAAASIRQRYRNGESLYKLADEYGVSYGNVYSVVKGWTWTDK